MGELGVLGWLKTKLHVQEFIVVCSSHFYDTGGSSHVGPTPTNIYSPVQKKQLVRQGKHCFLYVFVLRGKVSVYNPFLIWIRLNWDHRSLKRLNVKSLLTGTSFGLTSAGAGAYKQTRTVFHLFDIKWHICQLLVLFAFIFVTTIRRDQDQVTFMVHVQLTHLKCTGHMTVHEISFSGLNQLHHDQPLTEIWNSALENKSQFQSFTISSCGACMFSAVHPWAHLMCHTVDANNKHLSCSLPTFINFTSKFK